MFQLVLCNRSVVHNTQSIVMDFSFSYFQSPGSGEMNLFPDQTEDKPQFTIVKPEPGVCVKTKDNKGEKIFVNICKTSQVNFVFKLIYRYKSDLYLIGFSARLHMELE